MSPPVCHSYFQNKLLIFDSIFEHNYIESWSFPTLEAEFSNRVWTRELLHPHPLLGQHQRLVKDV